MKIVIVIPTYNEADNIERLIPVLTQEFNKMPQHDFHLLIVDGNSPDGTAKVVADFASKQSCVHLLLEQEKAGLGAAYVYGFKHAMNEMRADVIMEMDADFQHDPKDVVRMIEKIDAGADYVLGSRFTKGGSVPKEWGFKRKLMSWGGSMFSKVVLLIFDVTDFTTGFKASRVKGFVDKLDLDAILSKGFAYKIDLLYRMHKLGAKIEEVPIAFGLRDRGSSKMERGNLMDSMRVVLSIRYRESQSFFKFVVVGFIGLFTDTFFFNLFRVLLTSSRVASASSGLIAMMVTYTLNNAWSFKDRKISSAKQTLKSMIIYFVSSYIPIIFRSLLVGFSIRTFGDTALVANAAFFVGIVIGLIWNFTVYSKIIWRRSR